MAIYKYKKANLFHFADDFDAIIHGCNCFHTMGAGFAKQMKQIYPEAYETDLMTEYGDVYKLGTISHTQQTKPVIINAYTQYSYGKGERQVEYTAIKTCMEEADDMLDFLFTSKKLVKVAMPKIGAGLGGGEWTTIESIINRATPHLDITVFEL